MKSLTTQEKITLLTKLEERIDTLHKLIDGAVDMGFSTSKVAEAVYHMQDAAIHYAAALVEDPYEWVSWYFYDSKHNIPNSALNIVTVGKKKYKVDNVKMLVKIMEMKT